MTTSKVSKSSYVVNVPEVLQLSGDFVYNFYTKNERVSATNGLNANLAPRYVSLSWVAPPKYENYQYVVGKETTNQLLEKLVTEDSSFSSNYLSRNFSEVTDVKQAALQLKNYYGFSDFFYFNSLLDKKQKIIKDFIESNASLNPQERSRLEQNLKHLHDAYDALTDLPSQTLGLDVVDAEGNVIDKQNLFKTLTSSLSLNVKLHKYVIQDLLSNAEISKIELDKFANYKINVNNSDDIVLQASEIKVGENSTPRLKGFLIRRYRYGQDGNLTEELVKYLNNPQATSFNDSGVVYGGNYVYAVSVVAEIDILANKIGSNNNPSGTDTLTINIESRLSLFNISCFEFKPPPPPTDIKFYFDYIKRNVAMTWDFPVNPQSDIRQFQVFRRKSFDHPFELIAQYGFDRSLTDYITAPILTSEFEGSLNFEGMPYSPNDASQISNKKYTTGERVDANNIENMDPSLRYLVKDSDLPVYKHVDEDFVVDNEFFESTSYIYAMCAIDAHGMISNYSSQYRITYDFFKNSLITEMVCDEGSPRTYPNMNLRSDTFKDSINTTGMKLKNLEIYFTPEYFNVLDEQGTEFNVVSIQKPNSQTDDEKPFYQFQMINLDNSKTQVLRINIEQPPPPPQDTITIIQDVPPEIEPPDIWQDLVT